MGSTSVLDECIAITTVKPMWLEEVVKGYQQDESSVKLLTALSVGQSLPHFTFKDGLLRFKNRVWLGNNKALQAQVMAALHSSASWGGGAFRISCYLQKSEGNVRLAGHEGDDQRYGSTMCGVLESKTRKGGLS